MKKKVVYAMIAIMGMSVVGCGSKASPSADESKQQEVQATEKESKEESEEESQQEEAQALPEELYKEVLDAYADAFTQGWDMFSYEENGFNYVYGLEEQYLQAGETMLSKMGYAFADVNNDGSPELFIGSIPSPTSSVARGYFNDMYTISDGNIISVAQGGERNAFYLGSDGAIYNAGSGGAAFTSYLKCSLDVNAHMYGDSETTNFPESWKNCQNCLKVEEALYSQGDAAGNFWWEYSTNVTDLSITYSEVRHEDLVISEAEAEELENKWNSIGGSIPYVAFENYAGASKDNSASQENTGVTQYYNAAGKYAGGQMNEQEAMTDAASRAYVYNTVIEGNTITFVGSMEIAGDDFNYQLQPWGEWKFELDENVKFVNSDEQEIEISKEEGMNSLRDGWIDMVFTAVDGKIVKVSFGC